MKKFLAMVRQYLKLNELIVRKTLVVTVIQCIPLVIVMWMSETDWGVVLWAFLLVVLAVVVTFFALKLAYRKFTAIVDQTIQITQEISHGNLALNLSAQDNNSGESKVIESLSVMTKHLSWSIKQIRKIAKSINDQSVQFEGDSQKLSDEVSSMAMGTEEVAAAIEEMSSNIHQNSDNAFRTRNIANDALVGVKKGNDSTQRAREAMNQIAQKISIVKEIAAQTNILALNAAVEAARAGEAGRGFSVVASEVKKLADKSRISAEEIEKITRRALLISERAGIDLEKLVPQIAQTVDLVNEISVSSNEQKVGADQISMAIGQLNHITQVNAQFSEMMKKRSAELSGKADLLNSIIKDYATS